MSRDGEQGDRQPTIDEETGRMDNGLGCGGGEGEEEELLEWEGGWFVRASVATAAGGCLSPARLCCLSNHSPLFVGAGGSWE